MPDLPPFYGNPIDTPDGHRWAGRVPAGTGDPVKYDRVTAALLAATDGATVSFDGTPYTGDGILVALPEHGSTVDAMATLQAATRTIDRWVHTVAPVVTASARRHFGAWVDDDTLYLDVVEVFSSADEDEARRAATLRGERAIWHNGRREEIHIHPTVDARFLQV